MNKQDWIEYFEAVNGRSPEEADFQAALANGEFVEEATAPVASEIPEVAMAVEETSTPAQPEVEPQPQVQSHVASQQVQSQQVPPIQFQQGDSSGSHQVYNVQVAVPSAFTIFWKQFWNWLVTAWKTPTLEQRAHKYNGLTAYGLLTLFTTLTFSAQMIKSGWMTFSSFIALWIGIAFVYFSFIFGGFIVKNVIYQEKSFTFLHSFDWFGRLLSLPLMFFTLASLFTFLDVHTVAALLVALSYFILVSATNYTLFHKTNHSKMDMFYKYLTAVLVYGIIIFVFFLLGAMIAGELFLNNILGGLNNLGGYYGGFGY